MEYLTKFCNNLSETVHKIFKNVLENTPQRCFIFFLKKLKSTCICFDREFKRFTFLKTELLGLFILKH